MRYSHGPLMVDYIDIRLYLAPGIVVPLIATVGINNKVTFLEKSGTGYAYDMMLFDYTLTIFVQFSKFHRRL